MIPDNVDKLYLEIVCKENNESEVKEDFSDQQVNCLI